MSAPTLQFDCRADKIAARLREKCYPDCDQSNGAPAARDGDFALIARRLEKEGRVQVRYGSTQRAYCLPCGDLRWTVVVPQGTRDFEWYKQTFEAIGLALFNSLMSPGSLYLPDDLKVAGDVLRAVFEEDQCFAEEFALAWILPYELMFSGASDFLIAKKAGCPIDYVAARWKMVERHARVADPAFIEREIRATRSRKRDEQRRFAMIAVAMIVVDVLIIRLLTMPSSNIFVDYAGLLNLDQAIIAGRIAFGLCMTSWVVACLLMYSSTRVIFGYRRPRWRVWFSVSTILIGLGFPSLMAIAALGDRVKECRLGLPAKGRMTPASWPFRDR